MFDLELLTDTSGTLWKAVLSVSNQGAKKGRGKRRGAGSIKDLNRGQELGSGNYWQLIRKTCSVRFNRSALKLLKHLKRQDKSRMARSEHSGDRGIKIQRHRSDWRGYRTHQSHSRVEK